MLGYRAAFALFAFAALMLGGCVESTPAVWHGWMYVGTRAGQIYGIADPAK